MCGTSVNKVRGTIDGIQTVHNRVEAAAFIDVARGACGRIGIAS
jgi:hypothetical protein